MKKFSLRRKIIIGLLLIGGLITLVASSVQVYWDYHTELAEIREEVAIVQEGGLPLLRSSMWALDDPQTRLVLAGIVSLPHVTGARVTGEHAQFDVGEIPGPDSAVRSHVFVIDYVNKGHYQHLGELHVHASLDPVYDKIYRHAGVILLVNAARTLLVAIIVGLFFEGVVTRHVRKVAKYLEHTPYSSDAAPLVLARSTRHWDELDELAQAVNHLRTKLNIYDREIREEKSRYYALVDNNPEAIWRCEIQRPIAVSSPVSAQVEGLQHYAVLAEINEAAAGLTGGNSRHDVIGADWRRLPFLQPAVWHDLVQNHYRLKDWISHFIDDRDQERFFSSSLTCLICDGHIKTIWGIAVEITQRVIAQRELENREQQLSLSQTRLAEAQSLAHMGHWAYKTEGDVLQVSDEFARIYGFDPRVDTPTWAQLIERIHPDDRDHVIHALSDPGSAAVGAEHRILWPNGEERHVQAIARKNVDAEQVATTFGIIMDITERRRAEEDRRRSQQALIESEARMAEAQAIAHLGHWILDQKTQSLSCSDEFFRLFGHPPQSFKPTMSDFYRQVHPDDQERIRDLFGSLQERALSYDYRIVRTDGAVRFMRGTITPFYSGGRDTQRVFGIAMDITEQKLAELELQASQELFRKAFAASPDAIAFIDLEHKTLIDVNQTLATMIGCPEKDLVGLPLTQFSERLGNPELPGLLERSAAEHNVEVRLQHDGGEIRICLLSWRPVDLVGRNCVLATLRDVTALRQLQHTADQQQKQLVRADKLASLGTMVAGVAHEINNPNHLIQMNAELLESFTHHVLEVLDDYLDEQQTQRQFNGVEFSEIVATVPELLADIKASSRRIDRIVKDLKDFSRPRDNAEFLPVDLNQVIEKARALFSSVLDKRKLQLTFDLAPDLPTLSGDSQRLEQVIVNLVTNAMDAVEGAEARIHVRTYRQNDHAVVCEVTDNGSGISAENLKHIFDPFFTTKQERGGTGLGLSISFRLIREHGGQLEAISEPGRGTTMRISLPIKPMTEPVFNL